MYKPFYNLRVRFAQCEMSQSPSMHGRSRRSPPRWASRRRNTASISLTTKGPFDDEKEKRPDMVEDV